MSSGEKEQKRMTRREFVKGAAVGAAAVAGAGVLAGCKKETPTPTSAPVPEPSAKTSAATPTPVPQKWDYEADVVVAGAGATGLPAAIEAAELGVSVILVDKNFRVGGFGMICGGVVGLGGGTRLQEKNGIEDSADLIFKDITDYKDVEFKKNDRALARAYADNNADAFQWLEEHGVKFLDQVTPVLQSTWGWGAPRCHYADNPTTSWEDGIPRGGAGVFMPLEAVAREKGFPILLEHALTGIIREKPLEGKVIGIEVEHEGRKLYIRARKGVIIATGGPKGNVELRRVFDPRLTEEYQATGEPWCFDTGDGIIAAQAIGAQLCSDKGVDQHWLIKRSTIGCRYASGFSPDSPVFHLQRATGLGVKDWQDCICVKKSGLRFANEVAGGFGETQIPISDAAMADGGGPIWAVFDAEAVEREGWDLGSQSVEPEFFFSGDTIAELAGKINVPASALQETVEKYNSYVDSGEDPEFEKPTPTYKIQTPPFYAAWATPVLHDTRAGLRINERSQVIDVYAKVIPGLYTGGEAAGGLSVLGIARAAIQGLIAARDAVAATP